MPTHHVVILKDVTRYPTGTSLENALPALADRLRALGGDPATDLGHHKVLATRQAAADIIRDVAVPPEASITLDCSQIEVISPPFIDELMKAWKMSGVVNANEDVRESWNIVASRLDPQVQST